jgi:hypothetical protein
VIQSAQKILFFSLDLSPTVETIQMQWQPGWDLKLRHSRSVLHTLMKGVLRAHGGFRLTCG